MADTEGNLRGENENEEGIFEEDKEGELDSDSPMPPPPAPKRYFTCPQCQKSFSRRNFRPNLQLANMVQVIRQMHPMPGIQIPVNEQGICPKHKQALKLFCQVDEEPICVVCQESGTHKYHNLVPLDEAVQEYKAKLQRQLQPLRKCLEDVQNRKAREEKRLIELKNRMKSELTSVALAFGQLTKFLTEEQAYTEQCLRNRHRAQLGRVGAVASNLSEQATQLRHLLAQVQQQSQEGGLQLLKNIKETLDKCEGVQLKPLAPSCSFLCQPQSHEYLKDSIVRKMEQVFCQVAKVDVTLDPDTVPPLKLPILSLPGFTPPTSGLLPNISGCLCMTQAHKFP